MEYNSHIHNEIVCILQAQSIIGRLICSRSSLSQFRPAPHMYASTFSHQGAARLTQPFAASIDHRAAPLEQLGAHCWFKDTSAVGEEGVCFSFASLTQIFSDTLQS